MKKQHLCPCCSQPLLRHISFKRIYWFCSQCYQEMPDMENILETQLAVRHWASKKITTPSHSEDRLWTIKKLYPRLDLDKELQNQACLNTISRT